MKVTRRRVNSACASLALCSIALLAYSNSFHARFTLDNGVQLQEKQIYAATPENIRKILGHTDWWRFWATMAP